MFSYNKPVYINPDTTFCGVSKDKKFTPEEIEELIKQMPPISPVKNKYDHDTHLYVRRDPPQGASVAEIVDFFFSNTGERRSLVDAYRFVLLYNKEARFLDVFAWVMEQCADRSLYGRWCDDVGRSVFRKDGAHKGLGWELVGPNGDGIVSPPKGNEFGYDNLIIMAKELLGKDYVCKPYELASYDAYMEAVYNQR